MPRQHLVDSFVRGVAVTVYNHATKAYVTGVVDAIEREDGSGNCYNVRIAGQWIFARTH